MQQAEARVLEITPTPRGFYTQSPGQKLLNSEVISKAVIYLVA
jgi:hypothetical protein